MELKIYNSKGTLKLTVSPSSSSTVTEEVMGEYCVCATFVHTEFVVLDVNDYVLVDGVKYKLRRNYKPEKKNSQCFNYQVKFHAPIHDAEDALFLFMADDDYQTEFSFDGTPQAHLHLWVDNMNRIAGSSLWSIGTVITGESKTIDYRNVYCWEAAFGSNGIAATFDTELWADGFVINLCKASRGVPVTLGYMQGLKKLQRSDSGNKRFFTRLFPLGSTRNIDATKYGSARLQLPSKAKYVDRNTELYGIKDAYEEAAFADIYPKYVGKVTAVRTGQKKSPEGRDYTVYYFQDNGMDFDPSLFEIPELVKMVSFQTGDLAGYGDKEGAFQANWDPKRKEWEIINVYPDETTQIPGGTLIPKVGDSYIPWNFRMPDSYLTAAEQAYQEAVNHFVDTYSFDPDIYTAPTDRNYIENNQIPLQVGQNVVLASDEYFRGIKETRITKVVRKLNDLNDATITCTDKIANGWKTEVENNLASLDYKLQKQIEQTMIDLIRTSDTKTPSDYNVFSSLKSISTFVRKDRDDRTPNKLSTDKAFEVGNFVTGASGAIIYKDKETGQTIGELDKLYVRMKAYFETLEIINTNSVGGKQNISPGGSMKCVKVEEAETYWRCYLLVEQDGAKIENRFHVDDFAYSKIFNAKAGVSNNISNNYYWRKVIAIGEDYIDLSKSHCDAGSEAPKVGDIINQRGNEKDKDRQSFIEFSAVDAFSPSITLYQGVNSYSLVGKDVVSFGVDKTTGKAFMNVYGDMYVGDREQKSYMRYTQEDGLEIKGKLGVGSTYNGKTFESFMHNTFTKQPTDEEGYGVGDMWVNATYPSEPPYKYEDQILRCVTAKQPGEPFSIDHWIPAASYKGDKIAEEALKKAEDAGKLANELKQTVGGIKDLTDKAFADGIISIGEKAAIEKMLKQIETTKQQVTKTYSEVYNNALLTGVPKTNLKNGYDAFVTACNELVKSITDTIADDKATSTEIALVDGKYDTFNVKYGDYMAYLAAAEKSIEDSIKTRVDKTIEELGGYKYLKAALKEQTTIQNGLVLSTLIGVGQTMDTGEYSIMAGISGIYDSGKRGGGIASWFGGSMVDKFDYYDAASGKFNVPQGVRPATGVDRMDGTGYRANGALWWDNDGKVHADPLSFFVGESTVGALLASFQVVTKSDGKPNYIIPKVPFQSLVISDHLAISDNAYLRYDSANKAVYVVGPNGEEVNFYATGDVSAYGKGSSTGGSGGSVTIVDSLTSTSTDAALSANQGRVLKGMIDSIKQQGTGVSNWKDLQGKPAWITDTKPSYSWTEITGRPTTFAPSSHKQAYTADECATYTADDNTLGCTPAAVRKAFEIIEPKAHTHSYASVVKVGNDTFKVSGNTISLPSYPTLSGLGGVSTSTFDTHKNDKVVHVTAAERTNWNNKLDKAIWDKAFYFDSSNNLRVKVNVVGEKDISAYGAGTSSGGGTFTIVDALTSTATDAALSANQGRVLKELIDKKSSVTNWSDLQGKPSWIGINKPSYTWEEITGKPVTFNPSDHNHNSLYVSSLGTSGNYLTWLKNGAVNNIVVPFSATTRKLVNSGAITDLNKPNWSDTQSITINNFQGTGITNAPEIHDNANTVINVAHSYHGSGGQWGYQLAQTNGSHRLFFREWSSGTPSTWKGFAFLNDTVAAAKKVVNPLTISLNGASKGAYDGSEKKDINITAASVGAVSTGDFNTHKGDKVVHITSTERTNWNDANSKKHTHANKSVLDGITSAKVSNWDGVVTNWNKAFYFDASGNLRVKVNVVGEKDVSAYGAGETSGGGSFTIVDALTSTSKDAALSANQGRVLKELIDKKSSVTNWADLQGKPSWIGANKPSYAWGEITGKPATFAPSSHFHNVLTSNELGTQNMSDTKLAWQSQLTSIVNGGSGYVGNYGFPCTNNANGILYLGTHTGRYGGQLGISSNERIYYRFISNGVFPTTTNGASWKSLAFLGDLTWGNIKNKPATFTPSTHSHQISQVTGLQSALDGKSPTSHTHNFFQIKDAINENLNAGTVRRKVIVCNTKNGNGYVSRAAIGLSNPNNQFSPVLLSVGTSDSGTAWTDYVFNPSGRLTSKLGTYAVLTDTIENSNKLGGKTLTEIRQDGYIMTAHKIDASKLDPNTWYPVTIQIPYGATIRIEIRVALDSGTKPSWSTHDNGFSVCTIWEVNGNHWGTQFVSRRIYASTYNYTQTDPVMNIGQLSNSANEYVYVRGGGAYKFYISHNATPVLRTTTFTASGQSISPAKSDLAKIKKSVVLNGDPHMFVSDNDNPFYQIKYNDQNWYVQIHENTMYLGMGTNNSIRIDASGNLISPKEITAYSDIRLKSNIKPLANRGIINPITYTKDGKESIGFSAQEVRELYPELVHEDEYGKHYLSVNYAQYVAVLQAQVIDLQRQIDELKKEDI